MQAINNKNDPVQAKGILSLTNWGGGEEISTIFIILFFICMSWAINQLSLPEASWQVTLQFINHQ